MKPQIVCQIGFGETDPVMYYSIKYYARDTQMYLKFTDTIFKGFFKYPIFKFKQIWYLLGKTVLELRPGEQH